MSKDKSLDKNSIKRYTYKRCYEIIKTTNMKTYDKGHSELILDKAINYGLKRRQYGMIEYIISKYCNDVYGTMKRS